jgi:hypothetical protein
MYIIGYYIYIILLILTRLYTRKTHKSPQIIPPGLAENSATPPSSTTTAPGSVATTCCWGRRRGWEAAGAGRLPVHQEGSKGPNTLANMKKPWETWEKPWETWEKPWETW